MPPLAPRPRCDLTGTAKSGATRSKTSSGKDQCWGVFRRFRPILKGRKTRQVPALRAEALGRKDRGDPKIAKSVSRPISRVLSLPLAGQWATIPLDRGSHPGSRNLPDRSCPRDRLTPPKGRRSYSVLLPAGLAVPLPLRVARWALTPPFHPHPPKRRKARRRADCSLWRYP
jgi:hypothetical protein